ncbi:hypothetical protein [Novosphingobium rosa]|uniref:hypothetical protein n=1 Tax=Novosphingobium rosa TaxID=76978 RepID=UPI00082C91D4|nr:hypothetical protein [Novosphingobium rosa]
MSGPVLCAVSPIATEGLMSFVTRTVTRNVLPSSFTLLRQVGLSHPNNPTAAFIENLDAVGLAEILRVPVEEVTRRRHLPLPEQGYVDCFGVAVRADEILVRTLRFAPSAVGASPHSRVLWSLKTVPCCTETWEYLLARCKCGRLQRWQHAYRFDRCDRCNRRLDLIQAETVPPDQRDGLAFLIGLLDPDTETRNAARRQLPTELADWDGGMVFELAIALMRLVTDPYRHTRTKVPPVGQQAKYARALSQTADLVRAWPSSFIPALERAVSKHSRSRYNVRYTGIAEYIPALESEVLPALVRTALDRQLATISSSPGTTPPGQIAMMAAVDRSLLPLGILAEGRRKGLLKSHICLRANRLFPTLDHAEVEEIRDLRDHRRSAEAVSTSLGLPQYAMQLIADSGDVDMRPHPFLTSLFEMPQMDWREHDRLLRDLRAAAMPGSTDPKKAGLTLPLHRLARAMGGGFKPWGTIFRSFLKKEGATPFFMAGNSISKMFIRPEDGDAFLSRNLRSHRPSSLTPYCSQRDAVEILNLPLKHAHLLKEFAKANDNWEMDWEIVLHLARTRITMAEMMARFGRHSSWVERYLDEEHCVQVDALGWKREPALQALERIRRRTKLRESP